MDDPTTALAQQLYHILVVLCNKGRPVATLMQIAPGPLAASGIAESDAADEESKEVINEWKREVTAVQGSLKAMFNSQFGSTFRSYNNPTYFSRKLFR